MERIEARGVDEGAGFLRGGCRDRQVDRAERHRRGEVGQVREDAFGTEQLAHETAGGGECRTVGIRGSAARAVNVEVDGMTGRDRARLDDAGQLGCMVDVQMRQQHGVEPLQ